MEDRTKPQNLVLAVRDVWVVYVKDSPRHSQLSEREYGTYDTEEEARRVCAKLESETTYHVILTKMTSLGPHRS
jgi:hypothetical protein